MTSVLSELMPLAYVYTHTNAFSHVDSHTFIFNTAKQKTKTSKPFFKRMFSLRNKVVLCISNSSNEKNNVSTEIWNSNEHDRSCCILVKVISKRVYCVCVLVILFHDYEEQKKLVKFRKLHKNHLNT